MQSNDTPRLKKNKGGGKEMKKILDRDDWERLPVKKNLSGQEALEAVKRDGMALQYVEERFGAKLASLSVGAAKEK